MKKYILTIALLSFSTVCISAAKIPSNKRSEVSMARCTKSETKEEKQEQKEEQKQDETCYENGRKTKRQAWNIRNGYSLNEYQPEKGDIAASRKSAAQKAMEGQ